MSTFFTWFSKALSLICMTITWIGPSWGRSKHHIILFLSKPIPFFFKSLYLLLSQNIYLFFIFLKRKEKEDPGLRSSQYKTKYDTSVAVVDETSHFTHRRLGKYTFILFLNKILFRSVNVNYSYSCRSSSSSSSPICRLSFFFVCVCFIIS